MNKMSGINVSIREPALHTQLIRNQQTMLELGTQEPPEPSQTFVIRYPFNQTSRAKSKNIRQTCNHPRGHYDREEGCFICNICGYQFRNELKQLKKQVEENNNPSPLDNLINTTEN